MSDGAGAGGWPALAQISREGADQLMHRLKTVADQCAPSPSNRFDRAHGECRREAVKARAACRPGSCLPASARPSKRPLAGQQLVEDHAQGIDVARRTVPPGKAVQLLGCHVFERAQAVAEPV